MNSTGGSTCCLQLLRVLDLTTFVIDLAVMKRGSYRLSPAIANMSPIHRSLPQLTCRTRQPCAAAGYMYDYD